MTINKGLILAPNSIQEKHRLRGEALWDIGSNFHEIFVHPGKFEECSNQNCSMLRQILNKTEIDGSGLFLR